MSIDVHAITSRLRIKSQQGDYDVEFFNDASAIANSFADVKDPFVIADEKVHALYPSVFSGVDPARVLTLSATEENKTLAGVERVATFMQQGGASRASTLILLGGGIIQDIGTFAAHIFYRGVPYIYVPTTLLSMSDSCIGAKCGVNLGAYKNQLGFFQSPKRVAVATAFLQSLPVNDLRSGFGEILKLSITAGDEAFAWFERRLRVHGFDLTEIDEAIERSLKTKQVIIEADEYERDVRKTLNYGHTFAHALETVTQHEVPHGLAVAWGVDVANFVANSAGRLATKTYERIHALIADHFSFDSHCFIDAHTLTAAMKRDKKAAAGNVQLILPSAIGNLEIVPTPIDANLEQDLRNYLAHEDIRGIV